MNASDSMDDVKSEDSSGDDNELTKKSTVYQFMPPQNTLSSKKPVETLIDDSSSPKRFSPLLRQVWVALAPIFSTFTAGLTVGMSATMLPELKLETSMEISNSDLSWIASVAVLPMAPGCLIAGVIMEKLGRKKCLQIHCIPALIGWIAIMCANNVQLIILGRFLSGISVGMLGPPSSVVIGESSEPKYRGFLLAGISLAISLGILVAHIFGTFLTWKTMSMVCVIFPILSFIWISSIPETPAWLMRQDRIEDSEHSFRWLRGYSSEVTEEFERMVKKHEYDQSAHEADASAMQKLKESVKKPEFVKPLLIVLGFFFVMQASGINTVAFYTVSIMKDILGDTVNEYLSMIVVDIVRVIISILACVLTRTMYRRTLTLFSGVGAGLCMQALAIFMYMSKQNSDKLENLSWISLIFLIGYICFMNSGFFALPWILCGELFSVATRSIGSGITSSFNFVIFFIVVKTANTLFELINVEGTFFLYGSFVLFGSVILYFTMLETKNKTLHEIEEEFKNPKKI